MGNTRKGDPVRDPTRAVGKHRAINLVAAESHTCATEQGFSTDWCWGAEHQGEVDAWNRSPHRPPTRVGRTRPISRPLAGAEVSRAESAGQTQLVCRGDLARLVTVLPASGLVVAVQDANAQTCSGFANAELRADIPIFAVSASRCCVWDAGANRLECVLSETIDFWAVSPADMEAGLPAVSMGSGFVCALRTGNRALCRGTAVAGTP